MVEGQRVAAGAGPNQHQEKGRAHTQRVLNVDQPAIETEKLGNQDELVRHGLVRVRVPGQEGFAQLPTFLPLGDESACGSGKKRGQGGSWWILQLSQTPWGRGPALWVKQANQGSPLQKHCWTPGSAVGHIQPPPVFINRVLLAHGHPLSCLLSVEAITSLAVTTGTQRPAKPKILTILLSRTSLPPPVLT